MITNGIVILKSKENCIGRTKMYRKTRNLTKIHADNSKVDFILIKFTLNRVPPRTDKIRYNIIKTPILLIASTSAGSGVIRPLPSMFPSRDWINTGKSTEQLNGGYYVDTFR